MLASLGRAGGADRREGNGGPDQMRPDLVMDVAELVWEPIAG
jgi:hypothetical protein